MSSRRRLALVLVVAILGAACGRERPPRRIVLMTLDTTRADHLGCYGDESARTPNLDGLADEGVLFEAAQSVVPVTLPAHSTMFTGVYPPVHGVRYNGMFHLDGSAVTLAERLRDAGWSTAAVVASFPLSERTGIGQGFDRFDDPSVGVDLSTVAPFEIERGADEISDLALRILEERKGQDLFLWLHYWDPHFPYEPPFPFSATHRDRPYAGEVAFMDRELGRVLERLRQEGWDDTLVVVAGDHGEGLWEHGEKMHANLTYESTLRVPLIVKPPGGGRGGRVEEPVSLVDLAPTVLDYAGVEAEGLEGSSLRASIEGGRAPEGRYLYFESLAGALTYGWSPLAGVRRGPWKYTRAPRPELFDLREDAGEQQNLYGVEGPRADELETRLSEMERLWSEGPTSASATPVPMDADAMAMLSSLGYVGTTMVESRDDGPDPKDLIRVEADIFTARDEAQAGRHEQARARLERVLSRDPSNRIALYVAARSAHALGDLTGSVDLSTRLVTAYPEFLPGVIFLGELQVASEDIEAALATFRDGLEHHPDDASLNYHLGVALYALDRANESLRVADAMVAKDLERPSFLVLRAACLAKLGKHEEALRALRSGLQAGYGDVDVLLEEPMLRPLRELEGFGEAIGSVGSS